MDFAHLSGTYPLLALTLILVLAGQSWMIKRHHFWWGAVIPSLSAVLIAGLAIAGGVLTITDFLFASLGLVGLVGWWIGARRSTRPNADDDSPLIIPLTAADSSVSFPPPGTGVRRQIFAQTG